MSSTGQDFAALLERVRAGDSAAAAELIRQYEPEIRRVIRMRWTDPRLRRVVDSMDVCQSVLANFFVRASAGEYDLREPRDLIALLVVMVRNKMTDQARRLQADRRDQRRMQFGGDSLFGRLRSDSLGPDRQAADRELLDEVRRRLSPDERYLAEQRAIGREWNDLATELGAAPDALRKKLTRALDRVAEQLSDKDPADDR